MRAEVKKSAEERLADAAALYDKYKEGYDAGESDGDKAYEGDYNRGYSEALTGDAYDRGYSDAYSLAAEQVENEFAEEVRAKTDAVNVLTYISAGIGSLCLASIIFLSLVILKVRRERR